MAVLLTWSVSHLLVFSSRASTANDNFANAQVIVGNEGMAGTVSDNSFGTGTEGGEPDFESTYGENPNLVGRTVWYRWTAPTNGTVVFETLNSDYDTVLSVYTGSSVNALTLVAGNNDVNTGLGNFVHREGSTSFVEFYAAAGTTYQVRVGSPSSGGPGVPGHIVLDWTQNGVQSTNYFSGQFRFATDFLGAVNPTLNRYTQTMPDGHVYPLYVFSENETAIPGGDRYARLTVTRMGGAVGRVFADYEIVPLTYTNFFFTNYFGTNFSFLDTSSNLIIVYSTNYIVTNVYGNATWFLPAPERRWYLTNIFAYSDVVSNGIFSTTNLIPMPTPPRTCNNQTGPPGPNGEFTNSFCRKLPTVTTNIPSFITNSSPLDVRDVNRFGSTANTGRITFNDFQMSADIAVRVDPGGGPAQFYLGPAGKADAPPVNRIFQVNITAVSVDPQESSDVLAPYVFYPGTIPALGSAIVNVMENSIAGWDGYPSNAIINLSRATWLISEKGSPAVLSVSRAGTNTGSVDVSWRLNYRSPNRPFSEDRYFCLPGSEYATEQPYTNSYYYSIATNDFLAVTGSLHWDANDFGAKEFEIPIIDDELPEFNEDIFVDLLNPLPLPSGSAAGGAMLGNLGYFNLSDGFGGFANLTILFDDQPAGAVDRNYNPNGSIFPSVPFPGANLTVMAVAVQTDDKAIIAGDFTSYNGIARNRIARVNNTGFLDTSFSPGSGANGFISALALQSSQIVAAGNFTSFNGQDRRRVVRLNADGSLDSSFNQLGLGANDTVWAVAVQSDGKIVIGGSFTNVCGEARNHVARLNANGSLDATFNPLGGADGVVNALAVQSDGKVIIGGDFVTVAGVSRSRVARLNTDGTLDNSYNPGAGANDVVYAVTLQPDGKALIGGVFTQMDYFPRNGLVRLNTDGSVDSTFDPGVGADDAVYTITLQTDGKLLIGGLFKSFNETRRVGLARLYDFGAVDTTFMDTAMNQYAGIPNRFHNELVQPRNFVFSIGVETTGRVLIGGSFSSVGGGGSRTDMRPRRNFAGLVGGATPGPGNLELMENQYSADENGSTTYVTMTRTNGDRGMINARFLASPPPPGPGAATFTNFTLFPQYTRPFWNSSWPGDVNPDWGLIRADGNFAMNYQPLAADFTLGNTHWLVFPGHTADILISLNDNASLDGDRALQYSLYRPGGTDFTLLGGENIPFGAALIRRASAMTILEDDNSPGVLGFSATNYTVSEGVGNAVLTVTRTNGGIGRVTVQYSTLSGTATAHSDFTPVTGTLTFESGETVKTISVPIIDDSQVEFDESFNVILTTPTGATLGLNSAFVTIVDNDIPGGRVNFTAASYSTNESAGLASISVARTGGSAGTLTVQCATIPGGTATAGTDYVSVTNTFTWNNGDVAIKTILVPILEDVLVEPDKTVNLLLFNPTLNGTPTNTPLSFSTTTNATLTIVNDDAVGAVRFSTTAYTINENGGVGYVTVVRTGGSSEAISVNFAATNGTAVAGYDFTATNGTLNFGPGEVSKTFTVPIIDNDFTDGTRSISLLLGNAAPTNALGNPAAALLSIVDNESVNEPPGGRDTAFSDEAAMNGAILAMALQPDGKIVTAGEFTMANGVPRNRIARLEPNGAIDSKFSYAAATAGANDTIRALLRQNDGRLVIGGDFTVVNNVNLNRIARLNLDGSLDTGFNPGAGTDNPVLALAETFVNETRKILVGGSFTVINAVNRNFIARLNDDGTPDMTFDPGLGCNGNVYAIAVQEDGKVLIGGDFTTVNETGRNHVARLNVDGSLDLSFDPGTGATDAVRAIAVQLDGRIVIGGSFTNYDGTAINRIARLLPDGSLDTATFNVGEGANDTVNSITIQPDTRIVLGGQFSRCSGVSRNHITRLNNDGTVDSGINFGTGANDFVAATLVQPDTKIVLGGGFTEYDGYPRQYLARIYGGSVVGSGQFEFLSATFQVDENGTNAVITVRRRGGTTSPVGQPIVTVDAVTSNGTATNGVNYVGGTFTLSFPQGEVLQTFVVPVINDFEINADRTVNLSLGSITPVPSAVLGDQPTATLVIINDDSSITFSSATYARNENAVDGVATITIVRNGSTVGTATAVFTTTTNGTATAIADYTPTLVPLTFNAGDTVKNITVPIVNDPLIENDETVTMELTNVLGALSLQPSQAELTIVDDDLGPGRIAFAATAYVVAENGTNAVVSLVRTNGRTGTVSVGFYTSDGTATSISSLDYTAQSGTVTFNDGETNKTLLVPITDDSVVEGAEFFTVTLTNATGGATILGPTNTVVTILDNDMGLTFSAPFYNVSEAGPSIVVTVLRVNGSNGVASVHYGTSNITATAGLDFTGDSGTLTFANGETVKNLTIPILQDTLVEGDEIFAVTLSNPSAGLQLLTPSTLVDILDDDSGVSFVQDAYSVAETATNVVLTVVRTGSYSGTITVAYSTIDDTAVLGADFSAPIPNPVPNQLIFTNGQGTNTITIPIANDALLEGDETFQVALSGPGGGAQLLEPSLATVTIVDNDAGISFSSTDYSVQEGGVAATITVLRTGITNSTVHVNYATGGGTATPGLASDYIATSGTLTFSNGVTTRTFNVPINQDNILEGAETVQLQLSLQSGPTNQAQLLNPQAATLVILDDDGSLIVPAGSVLTSESGPVNGGIDPGETVTLLFALRNAAGGNTTNLTATLLATNGVTLPSGAQNYGTLVENGPSRSRAFTFTASGTNGGVVSATFALDDASTNNLGVAIFNYQLGSATVTFSNTAAVVINDRTGDTPKPASPYPSTINVTGVGGTVGKVTVTLTNLAHTAPADVDMLLVGPTGTSLLMMSDAGSGNLITNVTLTFDDAAANSLPFSSQITNGTYKPTNYLLGDLFTNAPAPPWGAVLSGFNGLDPNGTWSLYVVDDTALDVGSIARGWYLNITTTGVIPGAADLSVTVTDTPDPVLLTSNLTYTIVVTNFGPSTATGVTVTDTLPAGAVLLSSNTPNGALSAAGGVVTWNIGTLAKDAVASATLVVSPTLVGTATNFALVSASPTDPNPVNNAATTTTTVNSLVADLVLFMFASPSPVTFGQDLVYTLAVANLGPATATRVTLTNTLPAGVSFVSASPAAYVVTGNTVAFTNLGNLGSGWGTNATITVHPNSGGTLTASAFCRQADPNVSDPKGNNAVTIKTIVEGFAPSLGIALSGANVVITWPASASGFVLQRATSLTTPITWTEVTVPAPTVVGDQQTVTLPVGSGNEYFRLGPP